MRNRILEERVWERDGGLESLRTGQGVWKDINPKTNRGVEERTGCGYSWSSEWTCGHTVTSD